MVLLAITITITSANTDRRMDVAARDSRGRSDAVTATRFLDKAVTLEVAMIACEASSCGPRPLILFAR